MKERLVEDWLINVNERGFEIPFCQILLAEGLRILRVGHSPYEDGKDILAMTTQGELQAYQLKAGDLDLDAFERHKPQIEALVEAAVRHPNVPDARRHKPFLVTTGNISDPVLNRVQNLNVSWKKRRYTPLTLIGRRQLHGDFVRLSGDFWPVDPPKLRSFRSLYLATGKSDLDKPELALFLFELLSTKREAFKTQVVRRITAANIFTSYLLGEFYRNADYWSVFEAWTITAAHIAWAAWAHRLLDGQWNRSFDLAVEAGAAALEALTAEALEPDAFVPPGFELDEITRARCTIGGSAVAAWHMLQALKGQRPETTDKAVKLVVDLAKRGRLVVWGESAVANWVAIIWFLERNTAARVDEMLLIALLQVVSERNHYRSGNPLPDPYCGADDVFEEQLEALKRPVRQEHRSSAHSYSLGPLITLAVRRLLRSFLAQMWYRISKVEMNSFCPASRNDFLLWKCSKGEEASTWPAAPQSWKVLQEESRRREGDRLPPLFTQRPDFALMFLLACPHRLTVPLVKALDDWLR